MKTIKTLLFLAGLTGGMFSSLAAQDPATNTPAQTSPAPAPSPAQAAADQTPQPATGAETAQPVVSETIAATNTPAVTTNAQAEAATTQSADTNAVADFPAGQGLRMNFRGVPLEQVLNYMSKAGGFIIHPKVSISGRVDAWSDQPMSKDEALDLLKHVLNDNGYATIVDGKDGRILTIISSTEAKKSEIPVMRFTSVADIPQNTDVATYIIPVRTLNPIALVKNLQPLVGSDTDLQANESANSLLMTDTQINIRRIAEIVVKLDSVSSTINSIKVYPLKYADAKTIAGLIKDLFPSAGGTSPNGQAGGAGAGGFGRFGGGGGRGGRGGGGAGGFGGGGGFPNLAAMFGQGGQTDPSGSTPSSRVAAVSDDHSNSLIVSAPEDLIPTIDELITKIDQPVEDITQVKLFHLTHADATEMAALLSSLFPDESNSADASQSVFQFGGRGGGFGGRGGLGGRVGGFGGGAAASTTAESDHMKKLYHVVAVPDQRTQSLLVSASKDLMPQIDEMVTELDEDASNVTHVHVIPLMNADPMDLQSVLQDIFPAGSGSRSQTSSTQNPLLQRQTTLLQQQNQSATTSSTLGSSTGRSGL